MNLATLSAQEVQRRMATTGLALRMAPVTVRLRSGLADFADQVRTLYRDFEVLDADAFADVDIRIVRVPGARRWAHPQVQFIVDGVTPFDPFPIDHALPLFEWGLNWVFSHRMHQFLLLHAAVVERGGRAIVFPAWPGSGKSTLAASLSCRGWRFLSDEFGVITLSGAEVLPFVRPVALKNESIEVMRAFDPGAHIGPTFPKTRKGDVAHFRVAKENVARGNEPAGIAAIVFPDFQSGATASTLPVTKAAAFLKVAGNSFNYEVVGERGFRALASIVGRCESFVLRYGNLDGAHSILDKIMARAPHS